jgi:glutaconate CoA-transferase subunit A
MDEDHIDAYADLGDAARAGDRAGLAAYISRYVTGPKNQDDYIDAIGGTAHLARLEAEARDR